MRRTDLPCLSASADPPPGIGNVRRPNRCTEGRQYLDRPRSALGAQFAQILFLCL